jgi:hypothetical protein
MAFTLLKPSGIDLSQTFAFTGSVTGAGGGKIGQVVISYFTDQTDFASVSFQNISGGSPAYSLRGLITPSSTSSKVYINYTIQAQHNSNRGYKTRILRGVSGTDTEIFAQPNQKDTYGDGDVNASRSSVQYLDSPNTTSQCEYMIQIGTDGAQTVTVAQSGSQCMITLMEVLA